MTRVLVAVAMLGSLLEGCEAVLGTGSLSERSADGGNEDGTTASSSGGSIGGSSSGSSQDASSSSSGGGADATSPHGGDSSAEGGSSGGGKDSSVDQTASGSSSGSSSGSTSGDSGSIPLGPVPTASSASMPGACTVGSYTSGLPSGSDYVNPTVYYPTNRAGCPGPFPGVVGIPGFTETQSGISQWGTFLASHGFVVMLVDTASGGTSNTGISPSQREATLTEGIATLRAENTRSGSPLFGQVGTTYMAVLGHSYGGGGALITANDHPELKAAIGLCPWNSSINYTMDTVPSVIFAGTADGLVSTGTGGMAPTEFASIPATTHKMYSEFTGGSHFVANTPLGDASTDIAVARFGLSWLEVFEVGDTRYQQFLVQDPTNSVFDIKP